MKLLPPLYKSQLFLIKEHQHELAATKGLFRLKGQTLSSSIQGTHTLFFLGRDLVHKSYWEKVIPLAKVKENDSTCIEGGENTILSGMQVSLLHLYYGHLLYEVQFCCPESWHYAKRKEFWGGRYYHLVSNYTFEDFQYF